MDVLDDKVSTGQPHPHTYTNAMWRSGGPAAAVVSLFRDDRVVLLGIGAATAAIIHTVVAYLRVLRDDKIVQPDVPKPTYITQETEDSLPLDTLDRLLVHPNESVRAIATRILCDRAVHNDDAMTDLLWGITRPDYEQRSRCLRAIEFLVLNNVGMLLCQAVESSRIYVPSL